MGRVITAEMYETLCILDKVGLVNSEINAIVGIRLFSTEEETTGPQVVGANLFSDLVVNADVNYPERVSGSPQNKQ